MPTDNPSVPVVVIGARGQLGSELCRQLGDAAIPLDLPEFDVTNRRLVLRVLSELEPRAIINASGYTHVDRAEQEEPLCEWINAKGISHLVEACNQIACKFVQMSTDYVFGQDSCRSTPYDESDEPGPLNVYGRTKLAGEKSAAVFPRHFIVRTCGLYGEPGPLTATASFVDKIVRLAAQKSDLRVVADQHCSPTYVPHLARAVLYLLNTLEYGTYHVVNSGGPTWHEFATEIVSWLGEPCIVRPISSSEFGAPAARPIYSVLNSAKYHALGGPPMPHWQEALQQHLRRQVTSEAG